MRCKGNTAFVKRKKVVPRSFSRGVHPLSLSLSLCLSLVGGGMREGRRPSCENPPLPVSSSCYLLISRSCCLYYICCGGGQTGGFCHGGRPCTWQAVFFSFFPHYMLVWGRGWCFLKTVPLFGVGGGVGSGGVVGGGEGRRGIWERGKGGRFDLSGMSCF